MFQTPVKMVLPNTILSSVLGTMNYLSIPYFVILSSFIVYLKRVMTMGKLGTGIDRESPKALSLHVK